jgi:hypothetical protein
VPELLGAERPEDLYGRAARFHSSIIGICRKASNGLKLDGDSNPVIEEMFVRLDGTIARSMSLPHLYIRERRQF